MLHLAGVTQAVLEGADQLVHLPMQGFVSSFNISCAAAIVLWEARRCRLERLGPQPELTAEQQDTLKAAMLLRHTVRQLQPCSRVVSRADSYNLLIGNNFLAAAEAQIHYDHPLLSI